MTINIGDSVRVIDGINAGCTGRVIGKTRILRKKVRIVLPDEASVIICPAKHLKII